MKKKMVSFMSGNSDGGILNRVRQLQDIYTGYDRYADDCSGQ